MTLQVFVISHVHNFSVFRKRIPKHFVELELDDIHDPFQLRSFYDSMILWFHEILLHSPIKSIKYFLFEVL